MAEITNEKVFDAEKKFVDFAGLDYFWEKAKAYIDAEDADLAGRLDDVEGDLSRVSDIIGTKIDVALNGLYYPDEAVDGKYVSSVSQSNGEIKVTRADLPDFTDAIATAKSEAVAHADGLNTAMDGRVKVLEAIDHEKLASDASAAAVATVLDGAPEKFDTLKEIAQWIADNEAADTAADLVTRVSAAEDAIDVINGDADTEGSIAKALNDAKAYADGLADNYDAAGSAATAEQNAKAYADSLAGNYDAAGSAAEALGDAKTYTDLLFDSIKFAETTDIDTIFNKVQPEPEA